MTVPKKYNHEDYMHKSSEANPTTKGDLYRYFQNDGEVVGAMVDSLLWQPSTAYAVGAVVHHPDMPAGYVARCTTAGTSSASDPDWQAGAVTDGTVKWEVVKPYLATDLNAIIKATLLMAHPVGSYYWSSDSTDPSKLFGGTWEALPPGYTLIAQGKGSDSFGSFEYKAGEKYGERMHKLTVGEMPKHYPKIACDNGNPTGNPTREIFHTKDCKDQYGPREMHNAMGEIGNDEAHNNIQPVVSAYCWLRTA